MQSAVNHRTGSFQECDDLIAQRGRNYLARERCHMGQARLDQGPREDKRDEPLRRETRTSPNL